MKRTSKLPAISRAIQYPLPADAFDPWVNRLLTAYLKDLGIIGRRAALADGERE